MTCFSNPAKRACLASSAGLSLRLIAPVYRSAGVTLWFSSRETALYKGHAKRIACELEQALPAKADWTEDLKREASYFRQHQQRMNYLGRREEDWIIGSGMVEGGAKRYQVRLCGPGMRWSRK